MVNLRDACTVPRTGRTIPATPSQCERDRAHRTIQLPQTQQIAGRRIAVNQQVARHAQHRTLSAGSFVVVRLRSVISARLIGQYRAGLPTLRNRWKARRYLSERAATYIKECCTASCSSLLQQPISSSSFILRLLRSTSTTRPTTINHHQNYQHYHNGLLRT